MQRQVRKQRNPSWRRVGGLVLILTILIAACGDSGVGSLVSEQNDANSSPLTLEQADQVAQTFLKAWAESDYGAMYALISPNARDAYDLETFANEYSSVANTLSLTAISTAVTGSLRQGTTAAVMYDAIFSTERFGDLQDAGRTMRLIETPEGWRVAWSRMDIFPELVEGARLTVASSQPGRGNIYDRNGELLADQDGRAVGLYIVRQDIANENVCIQALSRILRREEDDLAAQFARFDTPTLFLVGEIDPDTYQIEQQLLLQACDLGDDSYDIVSRRTRRYYGDAAPHLIGYVAQIQPDQVAQYERMGYPPDALVGQAGIEKAYEEVLAGKIGGKLVIVAPTGEVLRTLAEVPNEPGQSVYLTIDRKLQDAVQDALWEAYSVASPTWAQTSPGAAAVVMNVDTGEILAMASWPSYDPSVFHPDTPAWDRVGDITRLTSDPRRPLLNRATQALISPGSVFKMVSIAAGLDSGAVSPTTSVTCTGTWSNPNDGLPFRTDWLKTGHGYGINAQRGLTASCDPYFWELGVALHAIDPELIADYARMMGLGVPTGQTVLAEEVGQIPDRELIFRLQGTQWTLANTLNYVIGQGEMQVTPLQVTRMVAAIANGGKLYKPQFVSKIGLLSEPPSYQVQPEVTSVLEFDDEVFEIIRTAMCNVTLDRVEGTANYIFQPWYDWQQNEPIVCGKTGTAQTGGAGVKPQAWFAAYAPQDDPEIAVVVMVENSCEGSEVAAPLARRIFEDYYGLPHSTWPELWTSGCYDLGE